jgi:hypothetical protein
MLSLGERMRGVSRGIVISGSELEKVIRESLDPFTGWSGETADDKSLPRKSGD